MSAKIKKLLGDKDPLKVSLGCLSAMEIAFRCSDRSRLDIAKEQNRQGKPLTKVEVRVLREWSSLMQQYFTSDKPYLQCSALWAQIWISHGVRFNPSEFGLLLPSLVGLWRHSESSDIQYLSSWLIATVSIMRTGAVRFGEETSALEAFIKDKVDNPSKRYESCAALTLAY
jgi:hypothetical protein